MKPQKELKDVHDKMESFETKGSYLLTLEMFKQFPFKELDDYYRNEEEEC